MEEVPRRTSPVPLAFPCLLHSLIGVEGLSNYQGRGGDHFHCTVEPSPGHIRCRVSESFPGKAGLPECVQELLKIAWPDSTSIVILGALKGTEVR